MNATISANCVHDLGAVVSYRCKWQVLPGFKRYDNRNYGPMQRRLTSGIPAGGSGPSGGGEGDIILRNLAAEAAAVALVALAVMVANIQHL